MNTFKPDVTLPAYAPMLATYHRAHAAELRAIIADLPIYPGDQVLDMACGDGTYALWLAEQVGPAGAVVGVDIDPAYLQLAQQRAHASPNAARVRFEAGTVDCLPFDDDSFDLVWCAHSMYSLPDPIDVLHELRRVVRPGGTVAILEQDSFHYAMMPWPAELELAVRQAQLHSLQASEGTTSKFYIGRHLCSAFDTADLSFCRVTPYTTIRQAPLSDDEHAYLTWYLHDLAVRAGPHLEPAAHDAFNRYLDPGSHHFLLNRRDFYVIYVDVLARAIKSSS